MSRILGGLLLLALCGAATAQPANAQSRPESPGLDRPDAFEQSFATSLYMFDGCGDPLAGRMYRRALAERFAQCPFTAAARSRYQQRTRSQLAEMRETMAGLIERDGGLPMRLQGMPKTCHAQQADDDYKQYRGQLERYAQGALPAEAIIGAPCDATDLTP